MKIIGLVGLIGSGKNACAEYLVNCYGFNKESFASGVKDAVAVIFGWPRSMLEGDTIQSRAWREQPDAYWSKKFAREFSPREALQLMGTEAGRNVFHQDLWIHSLMRRMERDDGNYVISDVRFPNEIKAIKEAGGINIRVVRGSDPEWYLTALEENLHNNEGIMNAEYPDIHYSEWAHVGQKFDYVLDNSGTLLETYEKLNVILNI